MSIHYLSNNRWDQIILHLAPHLIIISVIIFGCIIFDAGYDNDSKITRSYILKILFWIIVALGIIVITPRFDNFDDSRLGYDGYVDISGRYLYYQPDYQIDTATTHELHEVGATHHHPLQEGWINTPGGQVQGRIGVPQGQLTKVKHGEPGTDLVEVTYTIGGASHKATVHVSDDKFIKLWNFVREKPLPLSVLDDGDFVVNRYSQK